MENVTNNPKTDAQTNATGNALSNGNARSDKQLFNIDEATNDRLNTGIKNFGNALGPAPSTVGGKVLKNAGIDQFADFVTGKNNFEGFSKNYQEGGLSQALGGVFDKVAQGFDSGDSQKYLANKTTDAAFNQITGELTKQAGLGDEGAAVANTINAVVKDKYNQAHYGADAQHETPADVRDTFSNIYTNTQAANTFSAGSDDPNAAKLGVFAANTLRDVSNS